MKKYKIDYFLKVNKHVKIWKSVIIEGYDEKYALGVFKQMKSNHKKVLVNITLDKE